jgi:hypothetical protein
MTLSVGGEIVGFDIEDRALVDMAWGDEIMGYEVAEPLGGEGI